MARTLTSPLHLARHVLAHEQGWAMFVELLPRDGVVGAPVYRLVKWPSGVVLGERWYQPAPFTIALPEETAEADYGPASLTIPNVSRVPGSLLESGDLLGRTLVVRLQHESRWNPSDLGPLEALSWRYRVLRGRATEASVTLSVGHWAVGAGGGGGGGDGDGFSGRDLPRRFFTRTDWPGLAPAAGVSIG